MALNKDFKVKNGATITQDLSVGGNAYLNALTGTNATFTKLTATEFEAASAIFTRTIVTSTSALSVINNGTGPALYVRQKGASQPIAEFVDQEGGVIYFADTGNLGINTKDPNEKLTVSGNVSATNNLSALRVAVCNTSYGGFISGGRDLADIFATSACSGSVCGSGTTGRITKWSGSTTLTDSIARESGSQFTIDGNLSATGNVTIAGNISACGGLSATQMNSYFGCNVGIGANSNHPVTTPPAAKLDIRGSSDGQLLLDTDGSDGFIKSDYNLELWADHDGGSSCRFENIYLKTNGDNTRMTINGSGNVGIGTGEITAAANSNPGEKLTVSGNISSCGSLSASGEGYNYLEARLGINTHKPDHMLDVAGSIGVGACLIHNGDDDTFIYFTEDDINIQAGGVNFIDITQDTASEITFNEAGANVDFRVEGTTDNGLLYTDAGTDKVGIGTRTPNEKLTIKGNLSATGTLSAERVAACNSSYGGFISGGRDLADIFVTASGNVDGSGTANFLPSWSDSNTLTNSIACQTSTQLTVKGNLSACGGLSATEMNSYFGCKVGIGTNTPDYTLDVAGDIGVDQYIYHNGDPNTYINLTNDRLRFNIGGISYIDLNDAGAQPHDITFNDGGNNVDVIIKGTGANEGNPLFKTDANTNKVGINGISVPNEELTVSGNISATGTLSAERVAVCNSSYGGFISGGRDLADIFATSSGNIDGSGTANYLPVFSDSNTIENSIACQSSTQLDVAGNLSACGGLSATKGVGYFACNVGIGTNRPERKFHVNSGIFDVGIRLESSDELAKIELKDNGGTAWIGSKSGALHLQGGGSDTVGSLVVKDGDVGIGTEVPGEKLTVAGNISACGGLSATQMPSYFACNVGINTNWPTSYLQVSALKTIDRDLLVICGGGASGNYDGLRVEAGNGTDLFRVNQLTYDVLMPSSGKVGIGTTTPNEKLTVAGNVSACGGLSATKGVGYFACKVGIGTNRPSEKLELGNGGKIGLKDSAGTYDSVIYNDGTTFKVADGAGSYHVDKINLLGLLDLGVGHTIKGIDNSIIANKDILAPKDGSFGFRTYGATNQYDAISSQFIDNNNNALSFNVKSGGTTSGAVRIDKDGNVGIGTTTPNQKLTVAGNISALGSLSAGLGEHVAVCNSSYGGFISGGRDLADIFATSSGNVDGSGTANFLPVWSDTDTICNSIACQSSTQLDVAGNLSACGGLSATQMNSYLACSVGIGTNRPQKKAHMCFAGNDGLRIQSTDNHAFTQIMANDSYSAYIQFRDGSNRYWLESKSDDTLEFRPNATSTAANKIVFDATGCVGIGNITPNEKLTVAGNISACGVLSAADAIRVPDDSKITLGNIQDLQLYHNGTDSYIDNRAGDLILRTVNTGDDIFVRAIDDVYIQPGNGASGITAKGGGAVELYYNGGNKKLETTNTGVTVTGNISACGGLSATKGVGYFACKVGIGTNKPETSLDIYSSVDQQTFCIEGSNSSVTPTARIRTVSTGSVLLLETATASDSRDILKAKNSAGTVLNLQADGKLGIGTEVPNEKLTVVGNISACGVLSASDAIRVPDSTCITLGNSQDLKLYHDGSNSYIRDESGTGDLIVSTNAYRLKSANNGETMMTAFEDGAVNLYHNNITRFRTDASGVDIVGGLSACNTRNGFVSAGRDLADIFATSSGNVDGSGTACFLPVWSDTDTIGNSIVCQPNACLLTVKGNLSACGGLSATQMNSYFACNVGIGTCRPTSKLFILDDDPVITLANNCNTAYGIEWKANSGSTFDACIKQTPSSGEFEFNVGRNSSWGGDFKFVVDTLDAYKIDRTLHRFYTCGSERMRINSDGNVGIKGGNPGQRLTVGGNISACGGLSATKGVGYFACKVGIGTNRPAADLHIKDASGDPTQILLEDADGGTQTAKIVFDQTAQNSLVLSTQYQSSTDLNLIQFAPADNVAMTIRGGTGSNDGNVGIGTTAPGEKLTVAGNISACGGLSATQMPSYFACSVGIGNNRPGTFGSDGNSLVVGSGSGGQGITIFAEDNNNANLYFADATSGTGSYVGYVQYRHSENKMAFGVSAGRKMTIDGGGCVGIGNTAPNQKLTVSGNISATGCLLLPDAGIIKLGNGNDLQLQHDGANSYISENGTGDLYVTTNNASVFIQDSNSARTMIAAKGGSGEKVELSQGGTIRLETTSTGTTTCGSQCVTNDLNVDGDASVRKLTVTRGASVTRGVSASSTHNGFVSAGRDLADIFATSSGNVDGSGTANFLPVWSDTDTIGNSIACQSCTQLTVKGNLSACGGLSATQMNNYFACKVGIGTNRPAYNLHIQKYDTTGPTIELQNSEYSAWINAWGSGASAGRTSRMEINAGSTNFAVGATTIRFQTPNVGDSNEKMRIDATGCVGIGTCAPQSLLHVAGGDIRIDNNRRYQTETAGGGVIDAVKMDSSDNLVIGDCNIKIDVSGTTPRMTIGTDSCACGFVGIGNDNTGCVLTPNERLTVGGSVSASGNGYFACVIAGGYFEQKAANDTLACYPTGTLVVIGECGDLIQSTKENDKKVFGVTQNGVCQPIVLGAEPVLVTGDIKIGDYITTSNKPGHGRKTCEPIYGSVIAQSMEAGAGNSHLVKAMIRKM